MGTRTTAQKRKRTIRVSSDLITASQLPSKKNAISRIVTQPAMQVCNFGCTKLGLSIYAGEKFKLDGAPFLSGAYGRLRRRTGEASTIDSQPWYCQLPSENCTTSRRLCGYEACIKTCLPIGKAIRENLGLRAFVVFFLSIKCIFIP